MKRIEIKGGPARGSGPPLISLLLLFFISLCLVGSVCEITFQLAKIKFQKQKKTKTNGTPKFGTTPVRDLLFFFFFFLVSSKKKRRNGRHFPTFGNGPNGKKWRFFFIAEFGDFFLGGGVYSTQIARIDRCFFIFL